MLWNGGCWRTELIPPLTDTEHSCDFQVFWEQRILAPSCPLNKRSKCSIHPPLHLLSTVQSLWWSLCRSLEQTIDTSALLTTRTQRSCYQRHSTFPGTLYILFPISGLWYIPLAGKRIIKPGEWPLSALVKHAGKKVWCFLRGHIIHWSKREGRSGMSDFTSVRCCGDTSIWAWTCLWENERAQVE